MKKSIAALSIIKCEVNKMLFKDKFKSSRKKQKLTQKDIGKMLNVSDRTIRAWESGESLPNKFISLERICDTLGVSMEFLFDTDTYLKINGK